ncbi:MAG: DUF1810 domain-containing protein [Luteimonas sp.]|nr:DUF1810 domain-containing protein [Luteimonas sp.]
MAVHPDLDRFVQAQRDSYEQALREIRAGRKRSHWMWYVFPQLRGLGASAMSQRYAITAIEEATAYVAHPVLGPRLVACCEAVLDSEIGVQAMFGTPDDLKLRSCATLFAAAAPEVAVFGRLLAEKLDGDRDQRTLELLGHSNDAKSPSQI